MTREVDLVSYLPPFLAEFKEIAVTLEAENPEFMLVWNAAERVLQNEFIETADEYGISRFEKILNILPSTEDTLESRRARVQARWLNTIPYTLRVLIQTLTVLCGGTDFKITHNFDVGYNFTLEFALELYGKVEELERMLGATLPCNIIINTKNKITSQLESKLYTYGGIAFAQDICI